MLLSGSSNCRLPGSQAPARPAAKLNGPHKASRGKDMRCRATEALQTPEGCLTWWWPRD